MARKATVRRTLQTLLASEKVRGSRWACHLLNQQTRGWQTLPIPQLQLQALHFKVGKLEEKRPLKPPQSSSKM